MVEVARISFPGVGESFCLPKSSQEEEHIKRRLQDQEDGFLCFVRLCENSSREQVACAIKLGDNLRLIFPDGDTKVIEISKSSFISQIHLFLPPTITLSLSSLPELHNMEFLVKQTCATSVHILLLSSQGYYASFHIQSTNSSISLDTSGIIPISHHIITTKSNTCAIELFFEASILCFRFSPSLGVAHIIKVDLSTFPEEINVPNTSNKSETQQTLQQQRQQIEERLLRIYHEGQKEQVFSQVLQLLGNTQNDAEKRIIGLHFLKSIYAQGEIDLINRLWRKCKNSNSFAIQPYRIIDMKELSLEKELGSGTFGSVYRGNWKNNEQEIQIPVAIKMIKDNSESFDLSDLRGEFCALSLLDHPNIIRMHGGGCVRQTLGVEFIHWFIVMDLMDGNLFQLIHSTIFLSFSLDDKIQLAKQICQGLEHLHNYNIIHRDIKPENILYKKQDGAYHLAVADLGICKPAVDTLLRTAIGTQLYMAPELRDTKNKFVEFAHEVDIYSMGILLWELFTRCTAQEFYSSLKQSPFRSKTSLRIPGNIPTWISKLIRLCTHKNPHKRPSASMIVNILSNPDSIVDFPPHKNYPSSTTPIKHAKERTKHKKSSDSIAVTPMPPRLKSIGPEWSYKTLRLWTALPEATQETMEESYQAYLLHGPSKNPLMIQKDFIVDFNRFTMTKKDSNSSYEIRRKLFTETPIECLLVSCEHINEDKEYIFHVHGYPHEDCTGFVESVACMYYSNENYKKITKIHHPFTFAVPSCHEWVIISIHCYLQAEYQIEYQLPKSSQRTLRKILWDDITSENRPKYISNYYPPYSEEEMKIVENIPVEMKQEAKAILAQIEMLCAQELPPFITSTGNERTHMYDMYVGISGYAYLFWKSATSGLFDSNQWEYLRQARRILLLCIENQKEESMFNISFWNSVSGSYALLSAVYMAEGLHDEIAPVIDHLLSISRSFIVSVIFEKELLQGFAGYMESLLFVVKHVPSTFYDVNRMKSILHKCFELICDSDLTQYSFNGVKYLGAAHGLGGILFILLHFPELCHSDRYRSDIQKALEFLVSQMVDGDILPFANSLALLHHWCHGAPGIIPVLMKAYEVYKDYKYVEIAEQGAEKIWTFGLLKKGFNLCHGISGNAYAFLEMYRCTKNEKYYYQALQFCAAYKDPRIILSIEAYKDPMRLVRGSSDCPYSLMEGISGTACLFIDLQNANQAAFPAYHGDLGSL